VKRRAALALLGLATLALATLVWTGLPGLEIVGSRRTAGISKPGAPASAPTTRQAAEMPPMAMRDLFRFGDEQAPATQPVPAAVAPTATTSAPPAETLAPARVRLVGFVRAGDKVKAALAIDASVDVLGVGEESNGFRLLAIDEDASRTRLRTPEGDEIEVALTPR
jgi:hypothetical protein